MTPEGFVGDKKKKGINIPGIGHKVRALRNPDKRVQLLISYARQIPRHGAAQFCPAGRGA